VRKQGIPRKAQRTKKVKSGPAPTETGFPSVTEEWYREEVNVARGRCKRRGVGLVLDVFHPSIKRGCPEGTGVCGIVRLSNGALNKCGRLLLSRQHPLLSPPFPEQRDRRKGIGFRV